MVSEGSKTEPLYFDEIRIDLRLPTANIAVAPSDLGTEPIQVVRMARGRFLVNCAGMIRRPATLDLGIAVLAGVVAAEDLTNRPTPKQKRLLA